MHTKTAYHSWAAMAIPEASVIRGRLDPGFKDLTSKSTGTASSRTETPKREGTTLGHGDTSSTGRTWLGAQQARELTRERSLAQVIRTTCPVGRGFGAPFCFPFQGEG